MQYKGKLPGCCAGEPDNTALPSRADMRHARRYACEQAAMGVPEALSTKDEAETHLAVGVQPAVHLSAKGCEGRIKVVLDCY